MHGELFYLERSESMDGKTLIERLQTRYACKSFDPNKKVSDADFAVLEEVLRLSPSSFGLQTWKFIVVKDPALKEKLKALSWNQEQITSCSHLICICSQVQVGQEQVDAHIDNVATTRDVPLESLQDYKQAMTNFVGSAALKPNLPFWSARQGYIALGFLLEAAAVMQIDSCPMEGFDAAGYNELLGLNGTGYTVSVLCPVGYRSPKDEFQHAKKVRFSKEQVIEYR